MFFPPKIQVNYFEGSKKTINASLQQTRQKNMVKGSEFLSQTLLFLIPISLQPNVVDL